MSGTTGVAGLGTRVDVLVSQQARRTPDAPAAACGGRTLTYRELDARVDAMAAMLARRGVGPGELVGVHLERSLDMLCAVLAIMRSGAAYVPLDPEFPSERLAHMVADSGLRCVVTQSSLRGEAPAGDYVRLELDNVDLPDAEPPAIAPRGDSLIYVLYTSGSTGKPKGVALEHRNVVNFLTSMQEEPGLDASDRLVAVTTLSFDIAGLELFLPLICGAQVVIASRDEAVDGDRLRALVEAVPATLMQATPTTWRMLIDAGWRGSPTFKVLCGGEALPADLAESLLQRCGELWNMYGPTETAIWSTCFRVRDAGAPILIGRPIANTQVYILDKAGRPAPTGVPGEIFIGGAGVARGYLNRPELTAERFLPDPFGAEAGGRMYRTGDFGRYVRDGQIEFRQRADHQVKIRGYRVELGEVEAAMSSQPGVKQAVAKVWELRPGDARLVGYVQPVGEGPCDVAALREHMRRIVPLYMIPQHFVEVDGFPLTPNGKVDRTRLADPRLADVLEESYVEPSTPSEREVAEIFGEVLGVPRVSAEASFFDLGGHSVLATRVVTRLRKLHPDVSLRMLFESATVTSLARSIDALQGPEGADAREVLEF